MGKNIKKNTNTISAWLLSIVMVLSLVIVPAGKVQAESVVAALDIDTSQQTTTADSDGNVEVSFTPPASYDSVSELSAAGVTQLQVTFKVTACEANGYAGGQAFFGYGSFWKNDNSWANIVQGSEVTSTLNLSSYLSGTESVYAYGIQFSNLVANSSFTYQIISAKLIGSDSSSSSSGGSTSGDSGSTDPSEIGTTDSKVTATLTRIDSSSSTDYQQYYLTVNNGLSTSIGDWVVAIPITGVTGSDAWDSSWAYVGLSYTDSYIYLAPKTGSTGVIAANGSYGGQTDNYKIHYKGPAITNTSGIQVYYKEGSTYTGAFETVISSGTQPSGGSSSSGGGSSTTPSAKSDETKDLGKNIDYNYAKLLQEALYFYDANMCGPDVETNTSVNWRKACHTCDTQVTYNGTTYDVSGGFHDAGDHDKFGLPQATSAAILGMGYYEYKDAYTLTGQTEHFKKILDYFCDYFERCTITDGTDTAVAFCYQVGDGNSHNYWVSAENENIDRPAYFADSSTPAADQVSAAAAALAIHYMNFGDTDYLTCAKRLFAMAKNNGKSTQNSHGGDYYKSNSWEDDYCLAAAWLYKATKDSSYMDEYNKYIGNVQMSGWPSWDQMGPYAAAYGEDSWPELGGNLTAALNQCESIDNGYSYLAMWASARYNCNMQFEGLLYDKHSNTDYYTSWAEGQMEYLLGNNNFNTCFVVGYNDLSSKYPHHRSASGYNGVFPDQNGGQVTQAYSLVGALVGGIKEGTYVDTANDYYYNEVALDYNAAFTGVAAALYLENKDKSNQVLATAEDTTLAKVIKTFYGQAAEDETPAANVTANTTSLICEALEYGYSSTTTTSITLHNEGDAATTSLEAKLEKGGAFEIVESVGSSIAINAYDTVEIAPVAGLQAGTYTDNLIVTYNGNKQITIPVTVTINKRSVTVTANNQTMTYGESVPDLTGDYSITSGSLVAENDLVVTLKTNASSSSQVDDYTITVTVGNNSNYNISTVDGTLTITPKAITNIEFPTASDIVVGDSLQKSVLSGGDTTFGTFAWKNSSESLGRGTHNVDAVLTLSDFAKRNYSFTGMTGYDSTVGTVTRTVSVNVLRAGLPSITFPTATELQYGQWLSASVFVGGSTEYGTFSWKNDNVKMEEVDVNNGIYTADVVFVWSDASKEQYGIEDTDSDATITKQISVKVTKADRTDKPETATLASRTANSITLQRIDGVQYSLDNIAWQDGNVFTGLSSFTKYTVYTRYKETSTHKASEVSASTLQVYTLVSNPYLINVSMLATDKAAVYIDALRETASSATTAIYDNGVLTLTATDKTYTITGNNSNVIVKAPYGSATTIILDNATIKQLDVTKQSATADTVVNVIVSGTSQVSEIISTSSNGVKITGTGILNVTSITVAGAFVLDGPTMHVDATGTDKPAISAGSVTISDGSVTAIGGTDSSAIIAETINITGGTVTATGGDGAAAITGDTITIDNSKVTATGGAGASAIEVTDADGQLTIKDADLEVNAGEGSDKSPISSENIILSGDNQVSSESGFDNIYSSTPKDENGKEMTSYTIILYKEDGTTQLLKTSLYVGSQFTLPDIEQKDGCIVSWKERTTGKTYEPKTSITIESDVVFVVSVQKIKVSKITLGTTVETIEVGDGVALVETVEPANAYDSSVTWTSNNTGVATVDQDGQVTGVAAGVAVITVTANDGSGKSASCTVTVVEGEPEEIAVEKIKITGATKKVAPGKKIKLQATVYPANATNTKVKWKVNNKKYATVNSKGVVTTKKAGKGKKVTVTAYSAEDNSIKATYKISIMKNPVKKIKLSAKTKTIKRGKSVTIKAKFTPSKGISKELTWTSSNKKIAKVNSKGKVTGKKKGTVKITAKAKDGSGKKATIKIKVK